MNLGITPNLSMAIERGWELQIKQERRWRVEATLTHGDFDEKIETIGQSFDEALTNLDDAVTSASKRNHKLFP